jgi:dienelactone hydrolase
VKTQALEYTNGRTQFIGHLAWDDSWDGARPGVLVFPEAFGLGEHARRRANRLAQEGYVALAADLHGGGRLYTDLAAVRPVIQALYGNRDEWRSMATAALHALTVQPLVDRNRIGAIGFCFGGTTCLELARTGAPVGAITTFHSGLIAGLPEDAGRMRAKVLICHGADDPLVTTEDIQGFMNEMRREAADWQFVYHGNTVHSFTEPAADARGLPGFSYSEKAESRSWAAMLHLFRETFG